MNDPFTKVTLLLPGETPSHMLVDDNTFYGPKELAETVIAAENAGKAHNLTTLTTSPQILLSYITIAYYASLATEEGRHLKCELILTNGRHSFFDLFEFDTPVDFSLENIRRLSPTCEDSRRGLRIIVIQGCLKIVGMTSFCFDGLQHRPGWLGLLPRPAEHGINITIAAPGHIKVRGSWIDVELRAGRIHHGYSLLHISGFSDLCKSASETLRQRLISETERCVLDMFGDPTEGVPFHRLIHRMLQRIMDSGRGGCLAFVYDEQYASDTDLFTPRYHSRSLSVADFAYEYIKDVMACHAQEGDPKNFTRDNIWRAERSLGKMLLACDTIGDLAGIDGCVVLDYKMKVHHFGSKINVSRERATESPQQFRRWSSEEVIELDTLEKFGGTRLRSALWLCKAIAPSILFVVSQDRSIRVLWSQIEGTSRVYSMPFLSTMSEA